MRLQRAIVALVAVAMPAFAAEPPTPAAPPAVAAPASTAAPKAVLPETEVKFGRVQPKDVLRHSFEIRNEGNAPLEILGVAANCKCTALDYDRVIAPGATGKITAAVDTRVLEGDNAGEIFVKTNDPKLSSFVLHTHVDVRSQLTAKPGYARWNTVQGEKEGTIGQTVWSLDGADFHVLRVDAPAGVRTAFRPATDTEQRKDVKGSQWHVDLTLASNAPIGAVEGYAEVVTDHPLQPVIRLPLSGFVRPLVFVTPPEGDYGTIELDGKTAKRGVFKFQNFATDKMAIVDARASIKGATVAVTPVEDGHTYTVVLQLDPKMPPGPFSGVIRLRTDSKKMPLVEVPIKGTVARVTASAKGGAASGSDAGTP